MISNIEIILEECGWKFKGKESTWELATFVVYKSKLEKALEAGQEIPLREKIIEVIKNVKNCRKSDIDKIAATIERLQIRNKKSRDT